MLGTLAVRGAEANAGHLELILSRTEEEMHCPRGTQITLEAGENRENAWTRHSKMSPRKCQRTLQLKCPKLFSDLRCQSPQSSLNSPSSIHFLKPTWMHRT